MEEPLRALQEVSARLRAAGIVHALGGSGLLRALGMPTEVHDWDIITDADQHQVERALAGYAYKRVGPKPPYRSAYLCRVSLGGCWVEVIGRFAVEVGGELTRIETVITGDYHGVPLGSPDAWLTVYQATRQRTKAAWLQRHVNSDKLG